MHNNMSQGKGLTHALAPDSTAKIAATHKQGRPQAYKKENVRHNRLFDCQGKRFLYEGMKRLNIGKRQIRRNNHLWKHWIAIIFKIDARGR